MGTYYYISGLHRDYVHSFPVRTSKFHFEMPCLGLYSRHGELVLCHCDTEGALCDWCSFIEAKYFSALLSYVLDS